MVTASEPKNWCIWLLLSAGGGSAFCFFFFFAFSSCALLVRLAWYTKLPRVGERTLAGEHDGVNVLVHELFHVDGRVGVGCGGSRQGKGNVIEHLGMEGIVCRNEATTEALR